MADRLGAVALAPVYLGTVALFAAVAAPLVALDAISRRLRAIACPPKESHRA